MSPQQTIAHYRITAKLGEGGMGEVWRATDTKLNRDVAIKILPEAFAQDADRMARFQREAQVLAALNHPNIAQIYGVEEGALVLELVEGEPLRGPQPLETTLDYARQIGAALEAAHEKGITHRDLKPANIMVTPQGAVKVLDFGLAAVAQSSSGDPTTSPTLTISPTRAGMILGTAAYMSPEQARGKPVDKRADIWAFGCVLYEMLAGKPPFLGADVSEILAAVIKDQPNLDTVPIQVRRLLRSCLEKDPKLRFRAIGDWTLLLDEPANAAALSNRRTWLWPGIAALSLAALGAVSFIHIREKPTAPAQPVRFTIDTPAHPLGQFTVAPDGRKIAYTARGADGALGLWVRPIDSLESHLLPASPGTTTTFWSPDSRYLVYQAAGQLKRIDITGGSPQTLCEVFGIMLGGSWNRSGVILFRRNVGEGIWRVSASGGAASPVTAVDASRKESSHSDPVFLPDGKHFFYLRHSFVPENSGLYLGSLDAGPERQNLKRLVATDLSFAYAPAGTRAGHLLFLREGSLMAQPFDSERMELAGEAVPIVAQVKTVLSRALFSVSANGVLAYRAGGGESGSYGWYDRGGHSLGAVSLPPGPAEVALSSDAAQLAFDRPSGTGAGSAVWKLDLLRGVSSQLTFNPKGGQGLVWSPDGAQLIFSDGSRLYRKASSGAGSEEPLLEAGSVISNDWSQDGRDVLYSVVGRNGKWELWLLHDPGGPAASSRKPVPYLQTAFNTSQGQFSPDTHWVAYTSDESGRVEIYVRPFPLSAERAGKWLVSSGGVSPRWRRDGKELFYLTVDSRLMAVEVSSGAVFKPGAPKELFGVSRATYSSEVHRYDVAPDGERFLAMPPDPAEASTPITVVLNWEVSLNR